MASSASGQSGRSSNDDGRSGFRPADGKPAKRPKKRVLKKKDRQDGFNLGTFDITGEDKKKG